MLVIRLIEENILSIFPLCGVWLKNSIWVDAVLSA
jgi:hypothetical protein